MRGHGGLARAEYLDSGLRADRRLANIDRTHQIGRLLGPGFSRRIFDLYGERGIHLRIFAIDFRLAGRRCLCVLNDGPHVAQRLLPVVIAGYDRHEGAVGGSADVLLLDARLKETPPAPRRLFQPPADDLQRQHVGQLVLIIDDRVGMRGPGSQPRHGQADRHARFHEDARRRRLRVRCAEIRDRRPLSRRSPVTEIILDQLFGNGRINVPGNRDHRVFRAIPTLVKRLHLRRGRGFQRVDRADRRMFGQWLSGEEMQSIGIRDAALRTVALSLFRQHDRPFSIDRTGVDIGFGHHPGQYLHAFGQAGLRRLGQVERIGRAGGRCLGVAVAAEGDAQTLPDTLGFAIRHMARPPHGEMLHIMSISLLIRALHERSDVHPQADRNLPRRNAIAPHRIAQPVGKRTEPPCSIDRHVAIFIEPGADLRLARPLIDRCCGLLRLGQRLRRAG